MSETTNVGLKHLTDFIINNRRVTFEAGGRVWKMRQPRPEEAADGRSAFRITRERVTNDKRLRSLAEGDKELLQREAIIRANAAELVYMLPLLLEDEGGNAVYDTANAKSMEEFESLEPAVIAIMADAYWGPIQDALREAKKKSQPSSSSR